MARTPLRDFLYLDTETVENYVAQLEGSLIDGPITNIVTSSNGKGGGAKLNIGVTQGNFDMNEATSHQQQSSMRLTPQNLFARMYKLLDQEESIQRLTGFDIAIYQQLKKQEFVEFQGIGSFSNWENLKTLFSAIPDFMKIMKYVDPDSPNDPEFQRAHDGMSTLIEQKKSEWPVLKVKPLNGACPFIARLNPTCIKRAPETFQSEVTVVARIQRVLQRGEKLEIFRVLDANKAMVLSKLPTANRQMRRQAQSKKIDMQSPIDEYVKYPAIEVLPIAVYQ